jgi:gluconate 2-dehydrogenase gamma chain
MPEPPTRRAFLKSVGALGAAALPVSSPVAATVDQAHGAHAASPGTSSPREILGEQEFAFIEAALDILIPTDELGPGARDAGVATFIDRQLASIWGGHGRNYRQGPWLEGAPTQGFQSPLTPREIYRLGIAETDRHCRSEHGKSFVELDRTRQESVLEALQAGTVPFDSMPAGLFFGMLWDNAVQGFFADPIHGGNRDKAGWRLIGYPGVAATYIDQITRHNVPYRVEPVSIADVQLGRVPVDQHGHPVHRVVRPREGGGA